MELLNDIIDPAELTAVTRGELLAREEADITQQLLPSRNVNDVRVEFEVNGKNSRTQGTPLRAWEAESAIGGSGGGEKRFAEVVPASWKVRFGEYERLRRSATAGSEGALAATESRRSEVLDVIQNRLKGLRSEALLTGKLAINERGLVTNVDFGRKPEFTATAASFWNIDGVDWLADYEAYVEAFYEENKVIPSVAVWGRQAANTVLNSAQTLARFPAANGSVTLEQINGLLVGRGLPTIVVNNNRDVLSPKHILLAVPGAGTLGETIWGPTSEATELPEYNLVGDEQAGIAVGVYRTVDPVVYWVHGAASYLPLLKNANMSLSAQVVA